MQWVVLAGPCGLVAVAKRMHAPMGYAGHTSGVRCACCHFTRIMTLRFPSGSRVHKRLLRCLAQHNPCDLTTELSSSRRFVFCCASSQAIQKVQHKIPVTETCYSAIDMHSRVQSSVLGRAGASGARNRLAQVCHAVATETGTEQQVTAKQQVVSYNGIDFVVEDDPDLKSSWGQRLTVASSSVTMALLMGSGVSHGIDGLQAALCIFAGYIFAGSVCCSIVLVPDRRPRVRSTRPWRAALPRHTCHPATAYPRVLQSASVNQH